MSEPMSAETINLHAEVGRLRARIAELEAQVTHCQEANTAEVERRRKAEANAKVLKLYEELRDELSPTTILLKNDDSAQRLAEIFRRIDAIKAGEEKA